MNDVRVGIIGGSGLGETLLEGIDPEGVESHQPETPFGRPSGPIVTGVLGGVPVALLSRHGEGHVLRPSVVPYRANVYALKMLGCTHVLASGATGSLHEQVHPGELVVCDQLIDRTDGRSRTFFEHAAVHVEFAEPFCPVMRRWLLAAAERLHGVKVHSRGTYVCMEGPSFSTKAESELHRQWGADVVGMTALPEARLAREAEMAYALIALPTDYDCWKPHDPTADAASLLQEIIGNLQRASAACLELVKEAMTDITMLGTDASPAHDALALAIWSDKSRIDPREVQRLAPLWARYFEDIPRAH